MNRVIATRRVARARARMRARTHARVRARTRTHARARARARRVAGRHHGYVKSYEFLIEIIRIRQICSRASEFADPYDKYRPGGAGSKKRFRIFTSAKSTCSVHRIFRE